MGGMWDWDWRDGAVWGGTGRGSTLQTQTCEQSCTFTLSAHSPLEQRIRRIAPSLNSVFTE